MSPQQRGPAHTPESCHHGTQEEVSQPHLCPLPPGELLDQITQHTQKGLARPVFNSELDNYVNSPFK